MSILNVGDTTTISSDSVVIKGFHGKQVKIISNIASAHGQYLIELLEEVRGVSMVYQQGRQFYAQYGELVHVTTNKDFKYLLRR